MNNVTNESANKVTRINKAMKALKSGFLVSKMRTFADIKQGNFRRIYNRHLKAYGY